MVMSCFMVTFHFFFEHGACHLTLAKIKGMTADRRRRDGARGNSRGITGIFPRPTMLLGHDPVADAAGKPHAVD